MAGHAADSKKRRFDWIGPGTVWVDGKAAAGRQNEALLRFGRSRAGSNREANSNSGRAAEKHLKPLIFYFCL